MSTIAKKQSLPKTPMKYNLNTEMVELVESLSSLNWTLGSHDLFSTQLKEITSRQSNKSLSSTQIVIDSIIKGYSSNCFDYDSIFDKINAVDLKLFQANIMRSSFEIVGESIRQAMNSWINSNEDILKKSND